MVTERMSNQPHPAGSMYTDADLSGADGKVRFARRVRKVTRSGPSRRMLHRA